MLHPQFIMVPIMLWCYVPSTTVSVGKEKRWYTKIKQQNLSSLSTVI